MKNALEDAFSLSVEAILEKGLAYHQTGHLTQAQEVYERILATQPMHFGALHLLGVVSYQCGRLLEAVDLIDKAISICPGIASAYSNRGLCLHALAEYSAALDSYDRALKIQPDYAEAYLNRGISLEALERYTDALDSYDRALKIQPECAKAHLNCGNALQRLNRYDDALGRYDRALNIKSDYAEAYSNRANALQALDRYAEALDSYECALRINPDNAADYLNRGNALSELHRYDEAVESYDSALKIKPDYADAYLNQGNALQALKRYEGALGCYKYALTIKPDFAEAHFNCGNTLQELKRYDEALDRYERALKAKPDYAAAYLNRGNTLKELKRCEEALDCYECALNIKPDFAEAYSNCGIALQDLKRFDEALDCYERALNIKPDFAEAYSNRGNTLRELGRFEEALKSYERALEIKPDCEFLFGTYLHTKMAVCDWNSLPEDLDRLESEIAILKRTSAPFPVLSLIDSPGLHKTASRIFSEAKFPSRPTYEAFSKRSRKGKILIGYYSADFHNHATAHLITELIESHKGDKFEVYGFSFGPNSKDDYRRRVSLAFHKFFDVRKRSDQDVAKMSRELGIQIAIDLKGYTIDARTGMFAERCAPIQVNFLGYPGTMAAEYIDYIIADKTVIPEARQSDFTEKIVYLPHSYQVNDSTRKISDRIFTKRDMGLPDTGFVFCCFNQSYKILPSMFDSWMRILAAIKGSVLWLIGDNMAAVENLRKEAEARGVSGSRLVFAKRMALEEHLARHRLADLFLDTFPCNAHTTTSDALWAGLPVLTRRGESFASRVSASLLRAIGLPELITRSQKEYEALAIDLALNVAKLTTLKSRLDANKATSSLFDGRVFANHIEIAYECMHTRYCEGLMPSNIFVSDNSDPPVVGATARASNFSSGSPRIK